jgi:hypothetical protein
LQRIGGSRRKIAELHFRGESRSEPTKESNMPSSVGVTTSYVFSITESHSETAGDVCTESVTKHESWAGRLEALVAERKRRVLSVIAVELATAGYSDEGLAERIAEKVVQSELEFYKDY